MEICGLIFYLRNIGVELTFQYGKIQARSNDILTDSIRNKITTHREELIVYLQVESACSELLVEPSYVINRLLSFDDEQDLINSNMSGIALKLHIKLWIAKGMPHYSGKPESIIYQGENKNDCT